MDKPTDHGIIFTCVAGGIFLLPGLLIYCLVAPPLLLLVPICPIISLICFRKGGRVARQFAWALILSFSAYSLYLWLTAFEVAASDAQGALIFIFGPLMVSIYSLVTAVLYLFLFLFVQFLRKLFCHA